MTKNTTDTEQLLNALRLCERSLLIAQKHSINLANLADVYPVLVRGLTIDIGNAIGYCAELTRLIAAGDDDE
jgi:hypothetical protein